MHTPSPKFFCPRCRTAYNTDQQYCGRCGADMQHVSGLAYAAQTERIRMASPTPGSSQGLGPDEHDPPPTSEGRPTESDRDGGATSELDADWLAPVATDRRAGGDRDDWLGRVVDSRYRVREIIGSGGMGVVYKVEHQRMGKIAAMKVLHHELAADPDVVIRFRREAEAVSRLTHPNTVQVFDFGTARGALYLIMEYVRGTDLGTLVKRDGPLSFARAAPLFAQVCAALGEAHALGVIHRDLKPENVLVTRTHGGHDFVKVLDFGLAKLSEREELSDVTGRGSIVGTPYYMSPEQIRGDPVDARSDIYSLGALMYRVLTGEPPFTAKNPVGVLTKHLTAELVPPSRCRPDLGISAPVDALIARALAKNAAARFPDINQMLAEIERVYVECCGSVPSGGMLGLSISSVMGGSGPVAAPVAIADDIDYGIESAARLRRSDIDVFERGLRRRRWVRITAVPVLLCVAAAVAAYLLFLRPTPLHTREAEPNDDIDSATPIAAGTAVTGYLGRRISRTTPDRDYYRVADPLPPASAVAVHVTALPNIDIELRAFDITGQLLVNRNEGGVGQAERIRNYRTERQIVVLVTEVMAGGPRLPTENVSDPYTLTVEINPAAPGIELEPNDDISDATAIGVGAPIAGYLDRRLDDDVFQFTGDRGRYQLRVSGASKVPLTWEVAGSPPHRERTAVIDLEPGATITLRRSDRDLPGDQLLPGADEPYAIQLDRPR